jgi:U32 family peptidase
MDHELLAPVGHIESFFAALENGANAVYLGLKQLSARASATNFSLSELASLVPFAHGRSISVYVALNSLITAPEFPGVLDLLQSLADLRVDGIIVQDPGVFYLVRRFFPQVKLHASTLMTVHNHAGVNQLERMGASRIVLARELNMNEIEKIAASTRAQLEVFVHGALCYSYSGLCLASSYRGGHSGLQGRCVQPCRLRFRQGKKEGFYLSCGDLCGLPLLPRLKQLRLAAFKLEGRMKSADYIAQVVKAYRLVLDAAPAREAEAVAQAQEWLLQSPSRRLTLGFLSPDPSREVLAPHRSGSSGLWAGTVKTVQARGILVALRHDVHPGDRLRPESLAGKEKETFTVSEIATPDGIPLEVGRAGEVVYLAGKAGVDAEERLFRIGSGLRSASGLWRTVRKEASETRRFRKSFPGLKGLWEDWPVSSVNLSRVAETLILKIGRAQELTRGFQSPADWVVLTATRDNLERIARQRLIPAQKNRLIWSLPLLLAEKELDYYRLALDWYLDKGFRTWEVNNWGHFDLFKDREKLNLIAGCRFNARNTASLAALAQTGCQWSVLSLEITRQELRSIVASPLASIPVISVYAWPPLFTSRLIPKLYEEKPFRTARKEEYFFRKRGAHSLIYADRPVNWLGEVPFLRSLGYRFFMLDLSEGPSDECHDIERILSGFKRLRADEPYSLFNLDRRP